jgi:hypothetical protein
MERAEMLEMWSDMAREGNWIPSWPDSLAGLMPEDAAWTPDPKCHSIWQEVVHVTFWRQATLNQIAGGKGPSAEEVEAKEFALPDHLNTESWAASVNELDRTHAEIAAAIQSPDADVSRIRYHLVHDAYHLGRIT